MSFWESVMQQGGMPIQAATPSEPSSSKEEKKSRRRKGDRGSQRVDQFGTVASSRPSAAPRLPEFSMPAGGQSMGRASARKRPKVMVLVLPNNQRTAISLSSRDSCAEFCTKVLARLDIPVDTSGPVPAIYFVPPGLKHDPAAVVTATEPLPSDFYPIAQIEETYGSPPMLTTDRTHFVIRLPEANAAPHSSGSLSPPAPVLTEEPPQPIEPAASPPRASSPSQQGSSSSSSSSAPTREPPSEDKSHAEETLEKLGRCMSEMLAHREQLPVIVQRAKEALTTFQAYFARAAGSATPLEHKIFVPVGGHVRALVLALQAVSTEGAAVALPNVLLQASLLLKDCEAGLAEIQSTKPQPIIAEPPPVLTEEPPPIASQPPSLSEPPPVIAESPPPLLTEAPPPIITEAPPPILSEAPPPILSEAPPPILSEAPPPILSEAPPPILSEAPPPILSEAPPPILSEAPPPILSEAPPPFICEAPPPILTEEASPVLTEAPPIILETPPPVLLSNSPPGLTNEPPHAHCALDLSDVSIPKPVLSDLPLPMSARRMKADADAETAAAQAEVAALRLEVEDLKKQVASQHAEVEEAKRAESSRSQLEAEISELTEEASQLKAALASKDRELKRSQRLLDGYEQDLEALRSTNPTEIFTRLLDTYSEEELVDMLRLIASTKA